MHTRVTTAVAALAVLCGAFSIAIIGAEPALAADGCNGGPRCGSVEGTPDGLLGRVQAQVDELNHYSSHPEPCSDEDPRVYGGRFDENTTVDYPGTLRWVPTLAGDDFWKAVTGDHGGTYFRLECWSPAWQALQGYGGEVEIREFPDINAANLARLALSDDFFLGLPAPEPHFNPAAPTLAQQETYLWVGNIPQGRVASPVISVPGVRVQAFAEASDVDWDMGNGEHVPCNGNAANDPGCSYAYPDGSANEAGGVYHGSATIVWTGTYEVNGNPAPTTIPIPRETPFEIGVAENAAVVTPG